MNRDIHLHDNPPKPPIQEVERRCIDACTLCGQNCPKCRTSDVEWDSKERRVTRCDTWLPKGYKAISLVLRFLVIVGGVLVIAEPHNFAKVLLGAVLAYTSFQTWWLIKKRQTRAASALEKTKRKGKPIPGAFAGGERFSIRMTRKGSYRFRKFCTDNNLTQREAMDIFLALAETHNIKDIAV